MIEIINHSGLEVDTESLKKAAELVLAEEGSGELVELSIGLVGRQEIKEANRRYRARDAATDVLSFILDGESMPEAVGQIIICPQVVKEKSGPAGFEKELNRVLIHGLLHILGYNHKSGESKRKMRSRESYYLRKLEA